MALGTWHILSVDECNYSEFCLEQLSNLPWAADLVSNLRNSGGPRKRENRPFMFEARFAYELHLAGLTPIYEYDAGVGGSSIDFFIPGDCPWLIELVCIEETILLEVATHTEELETGGEARFLMLDGSAKDQRLTEAGEMIKFQEKLYEKVWRHGKPHKFPIPDSNSRHLILVDSRGFSGGSGPIEDHIRQIMYGPRQVREQELVQFFRNKPVHGIFDPENKYDPAKVMMDRLHMIGFVNERRFEPGGMRQTWTFRPNHLMPGNERVFDYFPAALKRTEP